jgi:hypothetical protein
MINLLRMTYHNAYLGRYIQLSGVKRQALDDWELPIAVARMQEGITSEKNDLRNVIERYIRRD